MGEFTPQQILEGNLTPREKEVMKYLAKGWFLTEVHRYCDIRALQGRKQKVGYAQLLKIKKRAMRRLRRQYG
jgi:hypothetical protein